MRCIGTPSDVVSFEVFSVMPPSSNGTANSRSFGRLSRAATTTGGLSAPDVRARTNGTRAPAASAAAARTRRAGLREKAARGFTDVLGWPSSPRTIVGPGGFPEDLGAGSHGSETLGRRGPEEREGRRARRRGEVRRPRVRPDEERRARREARAGRRGRRGSEEERKRRRREDFLGKGKKALRPDLFARPPAEHGLDALGGEPRRKGHDVVRAPFLVHLRRKRLQHREVTRPEA